jgi:hypothetical protein
MSAQRKQRLMSILINQGPHYLDARKGDILVEKAVGGQESAKPTAETFLCLLRAFAIFRNGCVVPKLAEGQRLRDLPRGAISRKFHLTSK